MKLQKKHFDEELQSSSGSSYISASAIQAIVDKLKYQSNRVMTRQNYYAVWRQFNEFFIKLDTKPQSWEDRLVLFVGYLIGGNRKSTTIKSYISAIKKVLREDGVILNQDEYLLRSLTRACRLQNDTVTIRLPITKSILALILTALKQIFGTQPYLETLYAAMFTTVYYGLFRIGELTASEHSLKARDVHIAKNRLKLSFTLHSLKTHGYGDKPQVIKIVGEQPSDKDLLSIHKLKNSRFALDNRCCPFLILKLYLQARKFGRRKDSKQFFVFQDRSPVTTHNFRSALFKALNFAGLDSKMYGSHGFQAGRAVDMLEHLHLSVDTIKKFGWWRSNAVYRYLAI